LPPLASIVMFVPLAFVLRKASIKDYSDLALTAAALCVFGATAYLWIFDGRDRHFTLRFVSSKVQKASGAFGIQRAVGQSAGNIAGPQV
jgi:hypothetical protein